MSYFDSKVLTLLLTIILVPLDALAAPPIITDDLGTPGPGKWEINTELTVEKRKDETTYQVPNLDLNCGVGEHIQMNYVLSWNVLHADGSTIGGLGNSEAAIKWRFLDQDKQGIDMSVYPRLIFNNPTSSANRGLADKGTIFRLPFQIEKKVGIITINTEIGHDFRQRGRDEWI